jgi:hypothetical protein
MENSKIAKCKEYLSGFATLSCSFLAEEYICIRNGRLDDYPFHTKTALEMETNPSSLITISLEIHHMTCDI